MLDAIRISEYPQVRFRNERTEQKIMIETIKEMLGIAQCVYFSYLTLILIDFPPMRKAAEPRLYSWGMPK